MEKLKNNRFVLTICNIEKQYKIAFFSVIIFGVLAHGMALFNKYSVFDDIGSMYYLGSSYSSGRWMIGIFSELEYLIWGNGSVSLPLFNGGLSIVLTAISTCVIISIMDIRKKGTCIVLSGLMVSIPVITSLFGYMFTAPIYSLALLLSVCGCFLICKRRKWYQFLLGIVCFACSLGIYQAYFSVSLCILLIYLFKDIYFLNKGTHHYIKTSCYLFAACLSGFVLYLITNQCFLWIFDVKLDGYAGIKSMASESFFSYLHRIVIAYLRFFHPGDGNGLESRFVNSVNMYPVTIMRLYYILIAFIFALSVVLIVKSFRKSIQKGLILLLLVLLVPLAVNSIYVMCDSNAIYSLMMYSQTALFVFLAFLLETVDFKRKHIKTVSYSLGVCLLSLITIMYIRYDNTVYLKMDMYQQRLISYYSGLTTQIKSTPGYSDELPVTFVNERHINDKSFSEEERLEFVKIAPYQSLDFMVNNYMWKEFMATWVGYKPEYVDSAEFEGKQEVVKMPSYPDYGSIRIIDNTVVVKF